MIDATASGEWARTLDAHCALYRRVPEPLRARAVDLAQRFVRQKFFEGCGGMLLDDTMRRVIAFQACLLVAGRGLQCYAELRSVLVYPDTATVTVQPIRPGQAPAAASVSADVAEWEPGRMRIALSGSEAGPAYLLVSETWYPDWQATVDGKPAPVYRGDYAFLSVPLPPGAREVRLDFASQAYARGKLITAVALLATLGVLAGAAVKGRFRRTGD